MSRKLASPSNERANLDAYYRADINAVAALKKVALKRPLLERDIEKRLVQRAKELGGEVRKVKFIGHPGAPDRLLMLPAYLTNPSNLRRERTIWVELKAPGKKPEPHQLREHARMRKMGQRVKVIDSYEQIEELLK